MISTISQLLLLSSITVLSFVSNFAQSGVSISTGEELMASVKTGPCNNKERFEAVKKLFKEMGAADADIAVESFKDIQNVVITKKGKTDDKVVVGGHYDKVCHGCGTVDNWTGRELVLNEERQSFSNAFLFPDKYRPIFLYYPINQTLFRFAALVGY